MYTSKQTPVTNNDGTYNGFKNWETWCVNLWLTSQEPTNLMLEYLAETSKDIRQMADKAKKYILHNSPLNRQPSMYHDLLTSALDEVDWVQAVQFVWEVYHEQHHKDKQPVPEADTEQDTETNTPHAKPSNPEGF